MLFLVTIETFVLKSRSNCVVFTLGLLASNMPVERPMRSASWCLERRGETEREREAREDDESSMEDWAESMARAAVRRWAGEHSFRNRGSSQGGKPGVGGWSERESS